MFLFKYHFFVQKYLAIEDNLEEDKRELENQLGSNEKQSRQLENKCKSLIQQGKFTLIPRLNSWSSLIFDYA